MITKADMTEKNEMKVILGNEQVWVKVIALHSNRRDGIGVLMNNPINPMLRNSYPWGSFVWFRETNPEMIPVIISRVTAVPNTPEWEII